MDQDEFRDVSAFGVIIGAIVSIVGWVVGRRERKVEIERAIAEKEKFNAEVVELRGGRNAEFEKVINERARLVVTAYDQHVKDLVDEIDRQNVMVEYLYSIITVQTKKMEELKMELEETRKKIA